MIFKNTDPAKDGHIHEFQLDATEDYEVYPSINLKDDKLKIAIHLREKQTSRIRSFETSIDRSKLIQWIMEGIDKDIEVIT